jgi:adenylate cyclase
MAAYEYVLTGKILHHRTTREDNAEAQRMLDRAIALDPKYAHAHAWKACVLAQSWVHQWCDDRRQMWKQVVEQAHVALGLDDNDSDVHRVLAAVNLAHDEHTKAQYHQERALGLNPNNDLILVQQGEMLTWLGRPEDGIEWIRKAMRVNPYHPERFWNHLGRAHYTARQYAEAVAALSRITRPDCTHHGLLAAALAQLGDKTAATAHAQEVLREDPAFSNRRFLSTTHYQLDRDRDHLHEGLLKAGLPE